MDDAALEARLRAMEAELTALRAAVADRQAAATATPQTARPAADDEPAGRGPSRRALLGGAVAGAAAAVTGVLLTAEPAAAGTGTMQYGASNDSGGSQTSLTSTSAGRTLTVENTSNLTSGAGVAGVVTAGVGLDGSATTGTGLKGTATSGTGVRGAVSSGTGGSFASTGGIGIESEGARSPLWLHGEARNPPTSDGFAHKKGELVLDSAADLWLCTADGTPGTWRKVGGGTTSGSLTLLPAPVRIYDSRAGNPPNVAPQTPLAAAETRTLDTTANGSGVPAGATGLILNCAVVNAAPGDGNFTVWADLVARPKATTMVWGGDTGRCSTLAVTAISPARKIRVASSQRTDVVVDVVGYYR